MRKRRLYWTLQLAGWGFYAFINLFFITLNVLEQDESLIPTQQLEVIVQTPLLFLISHFVIRGVSRRRDWVQKDFGRNIPRIIGLTLATAIFTTLVVRLVSFSYQTTEINSDLITQMLFDALAFFILYAVWATIYFLYHYLESYNKSLKYEAAMNEMHLNQLKAQLNPHFIFNALNSMRALVDEEPLKAKVAITQLSNILRNSLIMDKKRVISFNDELSTVKDYLALESIRFEERLQVKFDIDPVSDRFEIPPMMIQTLVENAIKHGVSNLMQGGLVELSTKLDKARLIIVIRNSGQLINGKRKQKKGGGYGLANTKERLKLIYGGDASFRIYNENDKFVVTEVKIPQRV
jgi:sensor histidine kinase YesM